MNAPTIGLARLPRSVRELLDEAAGAAIAAAGALDALARDPTRRAALAEIAELELDGDRITHELQRALGTARVGREERGDLLRAIQAIDDVLDLIDDAARELSLVSGTERATSTIKDLVRTSMASVERIEEPPAARESLHERAHALDDELRTELRTMHRTVADAERDVLTTMRATAVLRRLRSIGQACIRALRAVELLASDHV
jgi:uncharacterized protein Yka (UPF0111/DUF47 family)